MAISTTPAVSYDASTSSTTRAPFADFSQWMTDLGPVIAQTKLKNLVIPGTHDSGTYNLSSSSSFYAGSSGDTAFKTISAAISLLSSSMAQNLATEVSSSIEDLVNGVYAFMSKTQSMTIAEQLDAGVRYLDFRIVYDSASGELWLKHSLLMSVQLSVALNDITTFVAAHPNEILILDFQALDEMDTALHASLVSTLETTFTFDGFSTIVPSSETSDVTMAELWATAETTGGPCTSVIIVYGDATTQQAYPDILWSRDKTVFQSNFADTTNLQDLYNFLVGPNNQQPADGLWVTQGQFTPSKGSVAQNIALGNGLVGPYALAQQATGWFARWVGSKWVKRGLNIVICDYIEMWNLVAECVAMNYPQNVQTVIGASSPGGDLQLIGAWSGTGTPYLCAWQDDTTAGIAGTWYIGRPLPVAGGPYSGLLAAGLDNNNTGSDLQVLTSGASDGRIYSACKQDTTGAWIAGDGILPDGTNGVTPKQIMAVRGTSFDIIILGDDGVLYRACYQDLHGAWQAGEALPNAPGSAVTYVSFAATTDTAGNVIIFAVGSDGALYQPCFRGGAAVFTLAYWIPGQTAAVATTPADTSWFCISPVTHSNGTTHVLGLYANDPGPLYRAVYRVAPNDGWVADGAIPTPTDNKGNPVQMLGLTAAIAPDGSIQALAVGPSTPYNPSYYDGNQWQAPASPQIPNGDPSGVNGLYSSFVVMAGNAGNLQVIAVDQNGKCHLPSWMGATGGWQAGGPMPIV